MRAYSKPVSLGMTRSGPTSHPLPLTNVTRPDVVGECLTPAEALAAAPAAEDDRFRVPRILDEEV